MRKLIFILFLLSLSVFGFSQSPKITFHHEEFEAFDGRMALHCDAKSETGFVLYDYLGSLDDVFFYPSYHTTIGPICGDYFGLTFDAHTSPRFNDLKKKIEAGNWRLPFVMLFRDCDEALSGYCDCKFTKSGLIEVTFAWGRIVSKKFPDFDQSRNRNAMRHHVELLDTKDIECFAIDDDVECMAISEEFGSSNSAVFFKALFDHGADDYDKYGRRSSNSAQTDGEATSPFKFRSTCTVEDLLRSPLGMGVNAWDTDLITLKNEIERCTQWEVGGDSDAIAVRPTSLKCGDCSVFSYCFSSGGHDASWYRLTGTRRAIMDLTQEITNFFKKSGFTLTNDSKIAADEVLFEKDAYSQTTHYKVAAFRNSGEVEYEIFLLIKHTKSWKAGQL